MKYHDNDVTFSCPGGEVLLSGTFTVKAFRITPGQDRDHLNRDGQVHVMNVDKKAKHGTFTFRCGRSSDDKDNTVATWFNGEIQPDQTTFGHEAGALNFAFIGTLDLTVRGHDGAQHTFTFDDIALAQGHALGNNWWFGGKQCLRTEHDGVIGYGRDSKGGKRAFTFLRGGNGVSTVDFVMNDLPWMNRLDDRVRLDEITMPGSHDAGMWETEHCDAADAASGAAYVQTQILSVGGQLVAGSRYFDIRVDYYCHRDHCELVTYHRSGGFGCNGQSLRSVLDETLGFLRENGGETAILKFSHIRKDESKTKQLIDDLMSEPKYATVMYKADRDDPNVNVASIPLGKVRGKMILVFDYDGYIDPANGRFRYRDAAAPQQCRSYDLKLNSRPNLTVYDCYSNTADYGTMRNDQLKKWESYAKTDADRFFLLSWTLTPDLESKKTIAMLAHEANQKLPAVLHDHIGWARPNVVYIDYVNSDTCRSIIELNTSKQV
jgi:hypothetical protein